MSFEELEAKRLLIISHKYKNRIIKADITADPIQKLLKNWVRNSPMYIAIPPGRVTKSAKYAPVVRKSCISSL